MSQSKLVLVTGATGNQGGACVDALLTRGHQVRVVTRNSASPAAKQLRERGVEIAVGDFTDLRDGRVLPLHYRQFQRGYAVTSYGSQGKTVDHVLFSDSGVRAASSAQQWYVTISRGRKSIRIFTPDKRALRNAVARSGEHELALDLIPQKASGTSKRHKILRSLRRGREFARRVCLMTMHSWSSEFLGIDLNQKYENRKSQANRASNARVLAA